jgi:hypothetical protein
VDATELQSDGALAGWVVNVKLTPVQNEGTSIRTRVFFGSEREERNFIAILKRINRAAKRRKTASAEWSG